MPKTPVPRISKLIGLSVRLDRLIRDGIVTDHAVTGPPVPRHPDIFDTDYEPALPGTGPPGRAVNVFQSAPRGEAGGNERNPLTTSRRCCFNPPPAVKRGERGHVSAVIDYFEFQSAPRGEAGGKGAC